MKLGNAHPASTPWTLRLDGSPVSVHDQLSEPNVLAAARLTRLARPLVFSFESIVPIRALYVAMTEIPRQQRDDEQQFKPDRFRPALRVQWQQRQILPFVLASCLRANAYGQMTAGK